jgi:ATP-dependent DNA helicase RecG
LSDGFSPQNDKAIKRLEYFCKNNDGLKLSEFDLKSRGPGEVFGTRQSGIPEFRLASMYDKELIMRVRKEIEGFKV